MLVHDDGAVGWGLARLAKVEEEARLGGLVVAAPLVSVAQGLLLLVVGRVGARRGLRRVAGGGVWLLLLLLLPLMLLLLLRLLLQLPLVLLVVQRLQRLAGGRAFCHGLAVAEGRVRGPTRC